MLRILTSYKSAVTFGVLWWPTFVNAVPYSNHAGELYSLSQTTPTSIYNQIIKTLGTFNSKYWVIISPLLLSLSILSVYVIHKMSRKSRNSAQFMGWGNNGDGYDKGSLRVRREKDALPPIHIGTESQDQPSTTANYQMYSSPLDSTCRLPPLRVVLQDLHPSPAGHIHHATPDNETYDFGDNPHYYDNNTQFGLSTPPPESPHALSISATPYVTNFQLSAPPRGHGHRRSWSTPSATSIHSQTSYPDAAQYPIPTLQPLASHAEELEPRSGQFRAFQYVTQYPRHTQRTYAYTAPVTPAPSTPSTPNMYAGSEQNEAEFQPVMIYEQGQSVTGKKWRRKVTIFRSDIYHRLESEGRLMG